ncbi:MAG TPA: TIGR01620 family protein [Hyphomicrobiaceae bacterium]|nr:TIGR01620 family protein [Hyphomicrobiaceae bacterium]
MTARDEVADEPRRRPRVFRPDDPALKAAPPPPVEPDIAADADQSETPNGTETPAPGAGKSGARIEAGIRWGGLLFAALVAATTLSLGLWFWRLVSVGLERDDVIGWIMRGIVGVAALAALVLLGREVFGLFRLGRLAGLRRDAETALARRDLASERSVVDRLGVLYGERRDLAWGLDRLKRHRADVHDPGALIALVERDVVREIDASARRVITSSAKRTAAVTAMSPMTSIAFLYLVYEVLRLLRRLATLYGGRPGFGGSLRLARTVIGNLIAAGGVALTDDLIGQFIGQDMLRRLSRRLGEGVFNGALVARIGVAALDVVRPVPFVEVKPVRVRDIVGEVMKSLQGGFGGRSEGGAKS